MESNKKILILVDWFPPAYKAGGPITSVKNVVEHLHESLNIYVLAGAYDLHSLDILPGIQTNTWIAQNGFHVQYLTQENLHKAGLQKVIFDLNPEVVYLNSFFSKNFTIIPLQILKKRKVKIILAPRGMLGSESLKIKWAKKKIFLWVSKFLGLYKSVFWHATSEKEAQEITQNYQIEKDAIRILPNFLPYQDISWESIALQKKNREKTSFLFVGRVVPIKNLLFMLDCFGDLTPEDKSRCSIKIVGPIEDQDYYQQCLQAAKNHQLNVEFLGDLVPEKVKEEYQKNHFFISTTLHENFGHSIAEALCYGCPVILSDQTPWKNLALLEVGWDLPLSDKKGFTEVISKGINMDENKYKQLGLNAYEYFKTISNQNIIKKDYISFFSKD